jgi:hypothetical protein
LTKRINYFCGVTPSNVNDIDAIQALFNGYSYNSSTKVNSTNTTNTSSRSSGTLPQKETIKLKND